jgi:hypothetical protein
MFRDVITLPLRIGARATRLGVRVAALGVTVAVRATERLAEVALPKPREPVGDAVAVEVEWPSETTPSTPPPAPVEHEARPASAPIRTQAPTPAHVSEEVQFVESFAEPGAEDGAGAAVHVDEPWEGYRHMTANDIIARLPDASREELAVVDLYERVHRGRRTVVGAAERQLRRATAAAHQHV